MEGKEERRESRNLDFASLEAQFQDLSEEFSKQHRKPVVDAQSLLYLNRPKSHAPLGELRSIFEERKHLFIEQECEKKSEEVQRPMEISKSVENIQVRNIEIYERNVNLCKVKQIKEKPKPKPLVLNDLELKPLPMQKTVSSLPIILIHTKSKLNSEKGISGL